MCRTNCLYYVLSVAPTQYAYNVYVSQQSIYRNTTSSKLQQNEKYLENSQGKFLCK